METTEQTALRERRRVGAGERWRQVVRWLLPSPGTLILIGVLLWAQSVGALPGAPAAAPASGSTSTVNYQGRLADSSGTPIDGVVTFKFALYDSPTEGALLWGPEVHADVPVSDGLFSVALGSLSGGIPQGILGGDLWLELTVAGETLSPRERLGAVPYAMQALSVPDGAISAAMLAPGAVSRMLVLRHDDAASSLADRTVVTGWGFIPGNGDVGLEENVDLGLMFEEEPPVVLVSYLGALESGTPPGSIGDFQGVGLSAVGAWTAVPTEITQSGFTVQISRSGGTFDPGRFYGYAWVAIGTAP
jgi:hypothetical protein